MPKKTVTKSKKPATTAQKLGSVIKSARDIMRKDKGLNGELDRLPQLTWIMFLKLLDDSEKLREVEAELEGTPYKQVIKPPYRWRDWAADDEGISGDRLKNFINNDEAELPDGTRGEGLIAYLRSLSSKTGRDRADVIAKVFKEVNNRMTSGVLLRDVINKVNEIHFDKSEEVNLLSLLYESMMKEMRDAAGDSGEFYTPRPVVRFMIQVMKPQLGETIHDPACGTGGFLVEAYEYLKASCTARDWKILQQSITGGEAKSLPYLLAQMNLLLHGFEYPDIDDKNSLRHTLSEMGKNSWVDLIPTNPPFGGEEEDKIQNNFPPDRKTKETALLFLQLIMRRLRKRPTAGRAGVVFPNGVLFGDGVCAKLKEDLLNNYNLHTIVRLPNGVFAPYTNIPTNLLFFDASGTTEDIWCYEIPVPDGRKNFTKTKPIQDEDFSDCLTWWENRQENDFAWKYKFREAYHQAKKEAQPHWDNAQEAEATASDCAKSIKELEGKIQALQTMILDFTPKDQKAEIEGQIKAVKEEVKQLTAEEGNLREIAKEEKAKGDTIYWAVYNLDRKNPHSQEAFEHLPPEQLLADILDKDRRVAEIMAQITEILKEALFAAESTNLLDKIPINGILSDVLHNKPRNGWSARCDNLPTGIPVLSLSAVTGFSYKETEFKRTSEPVLQDAHYWLNPGDLLITRSNSPELVGHAAIYNGFPSPCIYPDLMMRLDVDESKVDKQFVHHWLICAPIRRYIKSKAKGTSSSMKKISQSVVMNIPFPTGLSLSEQLQIVTYLDNLRNKIDEMKRLREEALRELDAMLPSILDKAFKGEL